MILVVDNSKDLSTAQMTPKLIDFLVRNSRVPIVVASNQDQVRTCLSMFRITGAIMSGGPLLLTERTRVDQYSQNIMVLLHAERHRLPVLGICFGMQVMAAAYGGVVTSMREKIQGREWVTRDMSAESDILGDMTCHPMLASHRDRIARVPHGFRVTSTSRGRSIIQSMEDTANQKYGVQFHPEGNECGHRILRRFIAKC